MALSSMGWERGRTTAPRAFHSLRRLFANSGFNQKSATAVFGDAEYHYACCGGESSDNSNDDSDDDDDEAEAEAAVAGA